MNKDEIKIYTHKLKSLFFDKINREWTKKWHKHNTNFEYATIKNKNAFIDDLLEDINKSLENRHELISSDNLRRILLGNTSGEWQHKTRNNIAIYLGFENWEHFVDQNQIIEKPKLNSKRNFGVRNYLIEITAILILAAFFVYKSKKIDEEIELKILKNNFSNVYPALLKVRVNVPANDLANYKILIENECYNYLNSAISIKSSNQTIPLYFFTPGLKLISLFHKDEKVKQLFYLVSSGNQWYGCARVNSAEIPQPFEGNTELMWYGKKIVDGNKPLNFLTTPAVWTNYLSTKPSNSVLNFPQELLLDKQRYFSRVAFMKAKNYGVDINNISISFKAKREHLNSSDCMSFMLQMFDESLNKFELYSSSKCLVDDNISMSKNRDVLKFNSNKNNLFKCEQINNHLEDFNWHKFDINLFNDNIIIQIDGKEVLNKPYQFNYGMLNEIAFVFEGNGSFDDLKILDNSTQKLINTN